MPFSHGWPPPSWSSILQTTFKRTGPRTPFPPTAAVVVPDPFLQHLLTIPPPAMQNATPASHYQHSSHYRSTVSPPQTPDDDSGTEQRHCGAQEGKACPHSIWYDGHRPWRIHGSLGDCGKKGRKGEPQLLQATPTVTALSQVAVAKKPRKVLELGGSGGMVGH